MALILKQRGESIGIWDLKKGEWHREPWTNRVTVAHIRLSRERGRLGEEANDKATEPKCWLDMVYAAIAVVSGVWLMQTLL